MVEALPRVLIVVVRQLELVVMLMVNALSGQKPRAWLDQVHITGMEQHALQILALRVHVAIMVSRRFVRNFIILSALLILEYMVETELRVLRFHVRGFAAIATRLAVVAVLALNQIALVIGVHGKIALYALERVASLICRVTIASLLAWMIAIVPEELTQVYVYRVTQYFASK